MAAAPAEPATLTMTALFDWAHSGGLSAQEQTERTEVARLIMAACRAPDDAPPSLVLVAADSIRLRGYLALSSLPAGLQIEADLDVTDCPNLAALPANLKVTGSLSLQHCTSLAWLPDTLRVGDNLCLNGCIGLRLLPENLVVPGDFSMQFCTGLQALPSGLRIGRNADFSYCIGLSCLPEDLHVAGNLALVGCRYITWLPAIVAHWPPLQNSVRTIQVAESGLSSMVQDFFSTLEFGRIYFDLGEEPDPDDIPFRTLAQSLAHFAELGVAHARAEGSRAIQAMLTRPQRHTLKLYLAKLLTTADYANPSTRPALMTRLEAALNGMLQDRTFCHQALGLMDDAMETCGDRVIRGLDAIELSLAVLQAERQDLSDARAALHRLGLGHQALAVVHKHAAKSCLQIPSVDEVEVYLAYEIALRQRLDLPGATIRMLYQARVPRKDIETAAKDALTQRGDAAAVAAFFASWPPWQRHVRREKSAGLRFEQLPQRSNGAQIPKYGRLTCPLTQEDELDLSQAVYMGEPHNPRVYEYENFMAWWTEHGTDPATRLTVTLGQLWRPSTTGAGAP